MGRFEKQTVTPIIKMFGMLSESLLDKFGPCGLLCEKCFAFGNGPIHLHARQLNHQLGNFEAYANRFVTLLNEPVFGKYPEFKVFLDLLSATSCKGCRKQECHLFNACKIKQCYKEKELAFCFQCNEFPCYHTGFDDHLKQRWISINHRIQEVGLETYYQEIKDKPRY